MRAPEFWANPPERPGWAARALGPAAAAYRLAAGWRATTGAPHRAGVPVICVGNLVVGGAGKTPTVLSICERLAALGLAPHVLSRGYGGSVKGPHRVDPETDDAADVGDEPLLIAAQHPVWVGKDRVASAKAAEAAGAQALVMDDGHQNPSLAKDLSLVVVDAAYGHGNRRTLPAGPLREPLAQGFARAHGVVLIGDPPPGAPPPETPAHLPVLRARLSPRQTGLNLSGLPVVAFAGIGRPEKFFQTLREAGARIVETAAFPDHHRYAPPILARLEARARAAGAFLVTTEKDAVRLPKSFVGRALPVPVMLGFEAPEALEALLRPLFQNAR